jgi:thiamine pyrophosphate-dependent acetolactate synthase large subunit-like protein
MVILMSDGAFGSIRTRAIKAGLTQEPLILEDRSWVPVLTALGLTATHAETIADVNDALTCWNPDNGPAFLEISFDPDLYVAMVKGIR